MSFPSVQEELNRKVLETLTKLHHDPVLMIS